MPPDDAQVSNAGPGSGSARRATPSGNTGERANAPAKAKTAPAAPAAVIGRANASARSDRVRPRAPSVRSNAPELATWRTTAWMTANRPATPATIAKAMSATIATLAAERTESRNSTSIVPAWASGASGAARRTAATMASGDGGSP